MRYYACIAMDVIKSRTLDVKEVEATLLTYSEKLNYQFKDSLLIPFEVRKGDELIGVIKEFNQSMPIIKAIEKMVENDNILSFYIGCGFGRIETSNKSNMDVANGSAIANALKARDHFAKGNKVEARVWRMSSNHTFFYSDEVPYQSLNSQYFIMRSYTDKRSKKQKQIIQAIEENPTKTYEEIGEKFGYKSPKTSVSNHLKASHYEITNQIEQSLLELLKYYQEQLESK
ncbi:SatD family protein [Halalkalibacillus halophilus]|uniref:SatD family protein n=1 Tax=Halalkalibacillus halophilus TaxID=392827 RepID=UPI00042A092E|nr:SatD family protein [Halalkalibacillus halophilus]